MGHPPVVDLVPEEEAVPTRRLGPLRQLDQRHRFDHLAERRQEDARFRSRDRHSEDLGDPHPGASQEGGEPITRRELEVLALVAAG
jgi:hypothetical protein